MILRCVAVAWIAFWIGALVTLHGFPVTATKPGEVFEWKALAELGGVVLGSVLIGFNAGVEHPRRGHE